MNSIRRSATAWWWPIGNGLVVATTMAERTREIQASFLDGLRRSELGAYLTQASEADAIMLRNLQRAADLVSSFKQIAVDRASSQRRHFLLRQFVAELMLPLSTQLKAAGLTLTQDVPEDLAMDSYPGPLGQVLSNLLENCLRHAFEGCSGGAINVRARGSDDGQTITLSIADTGVGIAADDLVHVYDPFFTTKLGSGGSGLGLHVAHNIVTGVLGGHTCMWRTTSSRACWAAISTPPAAPATPAAPPLPCSCPPRRRNRPRPERQARYNARKQFFRSTHEIPDRHGPAGSLRLRNGRTCPLVQVAQQDRRHPVVRPVHPGIWLGTGLGTVQR